MNSFETELYGWMNILILVLRRECQKNKREPEVEIKRTKINLSLRKLKGTLIFGNIHHSCKSMYVFVICVFMIYVVLANELIRHGACV